MSLFRNILQVFIYITAGGTIGTAVYQTLFYRSSYFSYVFFWQLIAVAAVCALGNLIFMSDKELSKKQIRVRYAIHYLYSGLAVMGGALLLKWIRPDRIRDLLFLFVLFTILYIVISVILTTKDKKVAEELNEKLKKYHMDEE